VTKPRFELRTYVVAWEVWFRILQSAILIEVFGGSREYLQANKIS
jgi:hypothetical protein